MARVSYFKSSNGNFDAMNVPFENKSILNYKRFKFVCDKWGIDCIHYSNAKRDRIIAYNTFPVKRVCKWFTAMGIDKKIHNQIITVIREKLLPEPVISISYEPTKEDCWDGDDSQQG